MTLPRSSNQQAQDEGDTGANEARRIREREATVSAAWRIVAYNEGASACTLARIVAESGLPAEHVEFVCAVRGHLLA